MRYSFFIFVIVVLLSSNGTAQFNDTLHIDYFGQTPPGKTAVVFSPDFICTPGLFVQNCCFSPDGKEFVFVFQNAAWNHPSIMYTQYINGQWSVPDTLFDYAAVPFFSYDGQHLYISKNGPVTRDIWVSTRGEKGWQEPVIVPSPVSSNFGNEFEVCEAANGTLYFSSDRPGGYGDMDIYRAELVNGSFPVATNLGIPINTSYKDECPYIAPDESFMIFNDWKPNQHFAGNNLYITYKKQDGSWTNPKDLGATINTNLLDIYPNVTPDGKYFIFTRRNGSVSGISSQLYWVRTDFVDSLRHTNFDPYCKNPIPNMTATVGVPFTYTIPDSTFCDDDINDTLTYSVVTLAKWLSYDAKTKSFSGTPTAKANGQYVAITATDPSNSSVLISFLITVQNANDVDENHSSVLEYKLIQNFPNPFNPSTTITYTLKSTTEVDITIFDALGRKIRTLLHGQQSAGNHQIQWNGTDEHGKKASSCIYFCRMNAEHFSQTQKMIVME